MTTYAVVGMTDDLSVLAVTAELVDLPGVNDVAVDLDKHSARVVGHVSREMVQEAVQRAGCDLRDH